MWLLLPLNRLKITKNQPPPGGSRPTLHLLSLAQQAKCSQKANFILDGIKKKKKVVFISSFPAVSCQLCLAEMSNNL